MKFATMIRNHDDMALESLASKGLLRRARRDLEAGKGKIENLDKDNALLLVDQESVNIHVKGPQSSTCTCKANGVCRHILLAMLLLRDGGADKTKRLTTASDEICAMPEARLVKFAGADWDKALDLFYSKPLAEISTEAVNVAVVFPELESSITLIAGNELKDAGFKGPKTRKRLLTVVAVLDIREQQGISPASTENTVASDVVPEAIITQAQSIIEQAVAATVPGRSTIGPDLFLDLAISSRCENLPRLSAELRGLSKSSKLAAEHHIEFEPSAFVQKASRTYALLEALRSKQTNPDLSGSVRRRYVKSEPIEVWALGVSQWRTGSGARGLSAYLLDPLSNRWHVLNQGRSASTDITFDVHSAYQMSLWGASTLSGAQMYTLKLTEPHLASDDSLSAKGSDAVRSPEPISLETLTESDAAHNEWRRLKQDVAGRMRTGLERRQTPVPALIVPSKYGKLGFNELNQTYGWELIDQHGESLVVHLNADQENSAVRLWRMGKAIKALVVECHLKNNNLYTRPVACVANAKRSTYLHNLDFDYWPRESSLKLMVANYREKISKPLVQPYSELDPLNRILSDASDELVGLLDTGVSNRLASITGNLQDCGLATLADQLGKVADMASSDSRGNREYMRAVMGASYLISELQQLQAFD